MGKIKGWGILMICCVLTQISVDLSAQNIIIDGTLDLRNKMFPNDQPISLEGNWEFYWQRHYSPDDFILDTPPEPDSYVKVPAYWTDYKETLPDITPMGFATYRMKVLLPQSFNEELAFKIPVFDSSCRLFINGRLVVTAGIPGQEESESLPGYKPYLYTMFHSEDEIEIIAQVSNFHHRRGGFWLPMKMGTREVVELRTNRENIFGAASAGMLFAFAGFFFFFFFIYKKDRSMLYFSLSTLGILVRSMSIGSIAFQNFFDISWTWMIRLEYIGTYFSIIFSLLYFYTLFPNRIAKYVNPVIIVIFCLFILTVFVTPVSIFSHTMVMFMPFIPVMLVYYMVLSFKIILRNRGYEIFIGLGFIALLVGAISDISLANSVILLSDKYILSHSVVFFIMMQVIILQYRWVHSYNEENRLLKEIEYVNRNLENIVIERTSELTNQKAEIEKQKGETDKKNSELEKNISIKNRIFSIIAHDLKSPVINISHMIDHMRTMPENESSSSLTDSLAQQSDFAINLIDNLLLWGEGQKNSIKYNAGKHNLTDIILSNFNLLSEWAKRKEIKMTYSHKGEPFALCDKELLNILIRNLLSNAIKFTNREGNISVSVEESFVKDGTIMIVIKDNGIGMSQEKLEQIMNHEIIDSSDGTENEKGTGLGLQLCFDLIKTNKGILTIESTEGVGSTFTIKVPSP